MVAGFDCWFSCVFCDVGYVYILILLDYSVIALGLTWFRACVWGLGIGFLLLRVLGLGIGFGVSYVWVSCPFVVGSCWFPEFGLLGVCIGCIVVIAISIYV